MLVWLKFATIRRLGVNAGCAEKFCHVCEYVKKTNILFLIKVEQSHMSFKERDLSVILLILYTLQSVNCLKYTLVNASTLFQICFSNRHNAGNSVPRAHFCGACRAKRGRVAHLPFKCVV